MIKIELTPEDVQLFIQLCAKVDPTSFIQPVVELREKIIKQANAQTVQQQVEPVDAVQD